MTSGVTTIVVTRDRWPDLAWSLPRQRAPAILVDNGSTDGTPGLVRESFRDVSVIELGRNLGAVARNVGVEAATTPYVAFADDDSWWPAASLHRAAGLLDRHLRLGLVAGRVLVGTEERLDPTCATMAASPLGTPAGLPGPAVLGFVACGAVVRRRGFLEAGGFDPVVQFRGEEERLALDLAAAGWQLAYVEEVVAHHHPADPRPELAAADARAPQRAAHRRHAAAVGVRLRDPRPAVAWWPGGTARRTPCAAPTAVGARPPATAACTGRGGATDARYRLTASSRSPPG